MKPFRRYPSLAGGLILAGLALAQTAPDAPEPASPVPAQDSGWRRMGGGQNVPAPANAPAPPQTIPSQLTIKPGTYVTVRVNQTLSSDHNQAGDVFSATLVRPVVVDGVIVADRGQTLGGRVTEAKKAGRVQGTSHLGIQLTDLPVVDGQQLPIQTSLISLNGPTSVGADAAAVAGTTAFGAALGAAVGWGTGAAIGAGAGAAAAIAGVLLTRGLPTVITSESALTFRIEQPVTISTERSPQTFRFVEPGEFNPPDQAPTLQRRPNYGPPPPAAGYYGPGYYPPYPYRYPYPYPYPYYWGGFYPYWGPGVVIGFHGGHW